MNIEGVCDCFEQTNDIFGYDRTDFIVQILFWENKQIISQTGNTREVQKSNVLLSSHRRKKLTK